MRLDVTVHCVHFCTLRTLLCRVLRLVLAVLFFCWFDAFDPLLRAVSLLWLCLCLSSSRQLALSLQAALRWTALSSLWLMLPCDLLSLRDCHARKALSLTRSITQSLTDTQIFILARVNSVSPASVPHCLGPCGAHAWTSCRVLRTGTSLSARYAQLSCSTGLNLIDTGLLLSNSCLL
jgi:hypothetical protein